MTSTPRAQSAKVSDFTPDTLNANLGTERGLAALDDSLRSLGAGRSILVDKEGRIIAGNKTQERAIDLGLQNAIVVETDGSALVVVKRTDLDLEKDPRARRLALADNRISELDLAWNPNALLQLTEEYGEEVAEGLWSDDEWRRSVLGLAAERDAVDGKERVAENDALREKWGTAQGQLWQIPSLSMPGHSHFVYCGDCTDSRSLALAMRGRLANLLVTSPPYWVGMKYEAQKTEADIDSFIVLCVRAWTDHVSVTNGRVVINTGTAAIHKLDKKRKTEVLPLVDKWQSALRQRGWLARNIRVWAKHGGFPATIGPRSDVVDQHWEHLVTFDHDSSEFDYLTTYWSPAGDQRGQERTESAWAQMGVWADVAGEASADGKHIAAFPVEIPRRFILLYSQAGEVVLDPFLGSGTTLIACELNHRLCAGVEISPNYLAGALERFADLGLAPTLANG